MTTPEDIADIGSLPDYIVLRQVQEALWTIGEVHGAAVMVGAGFSRLADRAAPTTPLPPLWRDFREEMLLALYPSGGGPTDPLVLAEEYRAALGDPALENLIRKRVPDEEWTPGPLHRRLLQLPWADVLTTNWDTLLERAAAADPDTSYNVVRVTTDIARARQPRIVKLHGSMPSYCPFIFSEEDFRTYPQRFAAFVNLAQQVLLENELCLLGFSGDDPNFLAWAGWVRDRLGKEARPIRLVGALDLPQSRRRLLERRNITPIDFSPLVRNHPREDRHRRAAEIFLESLWQARPKTTAEWQRRPEKEYGVKELGSPEAELAQLTKIWAEDRRKHPGWLVTPYHVREHARYGTSDSVRILAGNLSKVPASVRAPALFEAAWRWETLFWGLPDFLEQAVDAAVQADEDRLLAEEQCSLLRTAIVRAARRRRDWSSFEARIVRLEALGSADSKSEAAFERCLRARDEINYQYIEDNSAAIAGNDPIWLLRRASLLTEILDTQNAARTVREAYEEIRRRRAQDRRGLWLLSREAWASWLMQCARFELDEMRGQSDRPDWPLAYKAAETDPWDELHRIDAALDKADADKRKAEREREALFDAGTYRLVSGGIRFVSSAVTAPFEELSRLAERVGIPLRLGSFNVIEERFARSIEISFDDDAAGAWASLRSILSYDRGLVDIWFSRVAVARLPAAEIEDMSSKLRSAIAFGQKKIATAKDLAADWSSRVRSLIEILSRLTLRFESDAALEAFRFGAAMLSDPALKHWWLLEGLGNLMRRSLLAATPNRRGDAALDILSLPLACEKKIAGNERDFPELSDALSNMNWRIRDSSHPWTSRISFLLNVVAENKHTQSREHAVLRLLRLFEAVPSRMWLELG